MLTPSRIRENNGVLLHGQILLILETWKRSKTL